MCCHLQNHSIRETVPDLRRNNAGNRCERGLDSAPPWTRVRGDETRAGGEPGPQYSNPRFLVRQGWRFKLHQTTPIVQFPEQKLYISSTEAHSYPVQPILQNPTREFREASSVTAHLDRVFALEYRLLRTSPVIEGAFPAISWARSTDACTSSDSDTPRKISSSLAIPRAGTSPSRSVVTSSDTPTRSFPQNSAFLESSSPWCPHSPFSLGRRWRLAQLHQKQG